MLTVTLNDAAADLLDRLDPPGGLAPALRALATRGVRRHGPVLAWADATVDTTTLPDDLTGWECNATSFHLEDHVPVPVTLVDGRPSIARADQRTLLQHGFALARELGRSTRGLGPIRCIVAANDTNATFRFHQSRPGESWLAPDLDTYDSDHLLVVDLPD
jgi:hypothetical protein